MDSSKLETLREGAQADLAAATLGEALKLCIEAKVVQDHPQTQIKVQGSSTTAA
jgi:hypothetical protein